MARSVTSLAAHLRASEAAACGIRLHLSGGLRDDAARTATLPALLRAAVAQAPTASGGVRFFSTRGWGDDEEPPKRIIYPQALKDQLEKEGKLQEWMVGTEKSNPLNRTKEYNLEQDLMIQRAVAEHQKELYIMYIKQQSEHDVKMTATRAEFDKKLSAQSNENEVKLAAARAEFDKKLSAQSNENEVKLATVRVEFENKHNEQRKDYEVKLAALAKESDDKYKECMSKASEVDTAVRLIAQKYDDFMISADIRIDSMKDWYHKSVVGMMTIAGGFVATYIKQQN